MPLAYTHLVQLLVDALVLAAPFALAAEFGPVSTVAGTAPRSRTAASHARATSRLRGNGMPCVMMVLSSATTGRRAATAARTSSRTTNARCVLRRLASSIPPVVVLTSYNP